MIAHNFDAQEPVDWPQVSNGVMFIDLPLEVLHQLTQAAGDCTIIHMNCDDDAMIVDACMEYARVGAANGKSKISKGTLEHVVPLLPGLFEPIQGLLQVLHGVMIVLRQLAEPAGAKANS